MIIIDENGNRFTSLKAACRFHSVVDDGYLYRKIGQTGTVTKTGHTFTAQDFVPKPEPKPEQPQDNPQASSLLKRLEDIYTPDELERIASGEGLARPVDYPSIQLSGAHHRIMVISDTHIGSSYSPYEWHDLAAATAREQGCECVLHCGDLTEGMRIKRIGTQMYELSDLGYEAQKARAVEMMSKYGLPIYAIGGNHDAFFKEYAGADVVEAVADRVEGMTYLGGDAADIEIEGVRIRLWHGGDGNCFTEGTEILTKRGWVDFKDLDLEDEVATMTKEDHVFEWQKPTHIYQQKYYGKVYHFKNRKFDFSVTPNHRLWVKYNHNINRPLRHEVMPQKAHFKYDDKWHALTAEEIAEGWRKQKWVIPTTPKGYKQTDFTTYVDIPRLKSKNKGMEKKMHHFGRLEITEIAELIAWYVTEGYAQKNCVVISQYQSINPEKYQRIVSLAERIGCNHTDSPKGVILHGKELAEWLKATCGTGSRHKYIPAFIKDNSREILELVFNTCIDGDGWRCREGTGQIGYRSISHRLQTDVAEIALKLGYSSTFRADQVSLSKVQIEPSMVQRPEAEDYSGWIYCCSVPNELIYVRKNGRCFFSHNSYALSYRLQKVIESLPGGNKPGILLAGHVHKFCYIFERNVHAISCPSMQMQTPWMRGKRLAAHTGFLILDFEVKAGCVCNLSVKYYPFYA